jgi:excisionase family DNA binding protein
MDIASSIPEPVWDCVQAGRFLRLHPKTVKRMARNGQIPGRQLGRRWYFRPSELDELLRAGVTSSPKANRVAPQLSSKSQKEGIHAAANSKHVSRRLD